MKVYFIGAGPGAADLITVRGAKLLSQIKVVLYAGSLVPLSVLEHCHKDAVVYNTAELSLDQQVAYFEEAHKKGEDVARVHSGDPAIYGATAEQMHRLDQLDIEYEVVPGVSSFTAAAATIKRELTKPDVSQTVILTRVSGRASKVPETESIEFLARHKATMCIFLSGPHLKDIVDDLSVHYPAETPVALVYKASWPEERVHHSTLGTVLVETEVKDWKLTTMMLVGEVLKKGVTSTSRLYAKEYSHLFRAGLKAEAVRD